MLEGLITIVVYFMIGMLVLKLVWEYFPFKFIYGKLCYEEEGEDEEGEDDNDEEKKEKDK